MTSPSLNVQCQCRDERLLVTVLSTGCLSGCCSHCYAQALSLHAVKFWRRPWHRQPCPSSTKHVIAQPKGNLCLGSLPHWLSTVHPFRLVQVAVKLPLKVLPQAPTQEPRKGVGVSQELKVPSARFWGTLVQESACTGQQAHS